MNDVHKVTARKLRAFATAIRAERYAPHEFGVREAMAAEAVELDRRADELDPPKPAIEEPTEFGSMVRSPWNGRDRVWIRVNRGHWEEETGIGAEWSELHSPEVLRIGVGPEPLAEWENDLLNLQYRRDVAADVLRAMDVDQYLIDAVVNATQTDESAGALLDPSEVESSAATSSPALSSPSFCRTGQGCRLAEGHKGECKR